METVEIVPIAGTYSESFYYWSGLVFLALAKAKNLIGGYRTPKPFGLDEMDRCIDYDLAIADNLLESFERYGGAIQEANVLELGPGSDLGIGHYLMYLGAKGYTAFDRHPIAQRVSLEFYSRLQKRGIGLSPDVNYVAREDFDLSAHHWKSKFDVVFSNAAFEHFDDMSKTAKQLAEVVNPGGKLVANIDLQTHSRWIREHDPNNIYRYSRWLYRLFYFPGQPNRLRPADYRKAFEEAGWKDIRIKISRWHDSRGRAVHPDFRKCEMLDACSITLCATRP